MEFANIEYLFLLLLLIPYILWCLLYRKKYEPTFRMADTFAYQNVHKSLRLRLIELPHLLRVLVFVLIVIVLARPQTRNPEVYEHINAKGAALAEGLRQLVKRTGAPVVINQLGSLLAPFFTPTAVTTCTDAKGSDVAKYARYFQGMLERGVALAPAQFEAMFISEAHTQAELDATLAAAEAVFQTL